MNIQAGWLMQEEELVGVFFIISQWEFQVLDINFEVSLMIRKHTLFFSFIRWNPYYRELATNEQIISIQ